jgi:hypothetical protein
MQYRRQMSIAVTLIVIWATLTVGAAGQQDKSGDWPRRGRNALAEARAFADKMNARVKSLSPADADRSLQELDKALTALNRQIDELNTAIHKRDDGAEDLFKVQDVLFQAQRILFETQSLLFAARDGGRNTGSTHDVRPQGPSPDERAEKLKQELRRIDVAIKAGDAVVALSDVDLMVETKSVGSLRKGGKCAVERVQDEWLWVRSGDTRGWIDRRRVMSEKLLDWYRRLPDAEFVETDARTRVKLRGVLFDISSAGPRGLHIGSDVDYADPVTITLYGNLTVFLGQRRGDRDWGISLNFGPSAGWSGGLVPPPEARGRPYGTVMPGDYVSIDTQTHLVLVNGERRRLQ